MRAWSLLVMIAVGCGDPAVGPADAGAEDRAAPMDAAAPPDAGREDAAAVDAGDAQPVQVRIGDRYRVRTSTETVEGELIHQYDHRIWWWTPEEETTWALFNADAFAPYPNDRSVRFIRASTIEQVEPIAGAEPYREVLRRRGITLDGAPLTGESFILTAHESYHLEEDGFGDFAWDLVRLDQAGARFSGDGRFNQDYLVWGSQVVAPTAGVVVEVEDSAPDHPPGPWPDGAVNNLVGISLGGQYYLYVLHLMQGTIPPGITIGSTVAAGDPLGLVGNSGVSLEPHLHLVLLYFDPETGRSWSVPGEFRDVVIRTSSGAARRAFVDPPSGVFLMD